jgi:hypothetical protein
MQPSVFIRGPDKKYDVQYLLVGFCSGLVHFLKHSEAPHRPQKRKEFDLYTSNYVVAQGHHQGGNSHDFVSEIPILKLNSLVF